ncbi:MAG: hypothetical protein M0036_03345 [Desulfobacteraceae bacterium]|nr:hypothetical protein [Desulfobacteraceae bacterium]
MKKILIVEGPCIWNASIAKILEAEGYSIQTTRSAAAMKALLREFRADLVLIGLGVWHDQAWQLLRKLRASHPGLPALLYQVISGKGLEDLTGAVEAALIDAARKRTPNKPNHRRLYALQPAFAG